MAYNLSRNSRVFFTTNVAAGTGVVASSGFTTSNTFEIQVLDGFSFSQNTNQTTIAINEAGNTPIRGQKAFNTALNPVDISFSTYIRPRLESAQSTAEERVLWNALMGNVAIDGIGGTPITLGGTPSTATRASTTSPTVTITGTALTASGLTSGDIVTIKGVTGTGASYWNQPVKVGTISGTAIVVDYLSAPPAAAGTVSPAFTTSVKFDRAAWIENPTATGVATSYSQVSTAPSNRNQLQSFGMLFLVDNSWYVVDNCAMDSASIDFGLDAISTIAWTAKGTRLREVAVTGSDMSLTNPILGTGGLSGTATGKVITANYITNKLSTVTLQSNIGGVGGTSYNIVLTGGNMQIANNINYVTPNNIGTVNLPIGYYTGARAVSGTLNAYLRTGTGYAADLLNTMLTNAASAAETKYKLQVEIGGSNNATRVEAQMDGVVLGVPSVDVQDVISTSITFNAQGTNSTTSLNTYDIENTNDLVLRYFSV